MSFEQARLLRAIRELGYAPTTGDGLTHPIRDTRQNPWTAMEMSFAVTWTEYKSETMVGLALVVTDEVPVLGQALREGRLDLDKVKVIAKETELLEPEHRRAVVDEILDDAEHETTAQIRVRVRRVVLRVDPEAVRKAHKKAVEDRRITLAPLVATAGLAGARSSRSDDTYA